MTYNDFEGRSPGKSDEERLKDLSEEELKSFACHMRAYRADHTEYAHIYVLLDKLVPETLVEQFDHETNRIL